jgi:hypothetical protein
LEVQENEEARKRTPSSSSKSIRPKATTLSDECKQTPPPTLISVTKKEVQEEINISSVTPENPDHEPGDPSERTSSPISEEFQSVHESKDPSTLDPEDEKILLEVQPTVDIHNPEQSDIVSENIKSVTAAVDHRYDLLETHLSQIVDRLTKLEEIVFRQSVLKPKRSVHVRTPSSVASQTSPKRLSFEEELTPTRPTKKGKEKEVVVRTTPPISIPAYPRSAVARKVVLTRLFEQQGYSEVPGDYTQAEWEDGTLLRELTPSAKDLK